MPRPRKFTNLQRPKPINLLLPGLGRGVGRDKDRFRTSSSTKDARVFEARHAMVRDLAQRLQFPVLRALLDKRFTIVELHHAYRQGNAALAALVTQHSGKLVAPLLKTYLKQSVRRDKVKTGHRIDRFLETVGRRGEMPASDEPTATKQRRQWRERVTTSDLTSDAVASFLADLVTLSTITPRSVSGATRNRYRAAIGGFCTWLVRNHHLDLHPIAFKAVQKAPEDRHRMPDLSPQEYASYFRTMYETRPDLAVVFKLLIHSGADIGEVETRQVRDFDLSATAPRVHYIRSKTDTPERYVPIPQAVAVEVRGHVAAHGLRGTDVVFRMFKRSEIEAAHRSARDTIGRSDLRIKDLRHIAAIYWRRAGADLQTVKERLGHATIGQTVIYTAFGPSVASEAAGAEAAAALLMTDTDVLPFTPRQAIAT